MSCRCPAEAISRVGDRSVVFIVENGRVVERTILTRTPTGEGVPVLAGLDPKNRIIADAAGIKAGDTVRVR